MKNESTPAKSTRPIKLRDRATHTIVINLKRDFGFVPEEIAVEKVSGRNNVIVISALLTQKEIDKVESARKKSKRMAKGKEDSSGGRSKKRTAK